MSPCPESATLDEHEIQRAELRLMREDAWPTLSDAERTAWIEHEETLEACLRIMRQRREIAHEQIAHKRFKHRKSTI